MPAGRLSGLQVRVLRVLAGVRPRWSLTGGGALVGVHTGHRETRDLDLFWRRRGELGDLPREVADLLRSDGLVVETMQRTPAFYRFGVTGGEDTVLLDLVAEPVPAVEEPREVVVEGATILVDTRHEIFVSKLCTLLERSELRDLQDVRVLLEGGEDLERALREAPSKDAGFSPLTLAWVLRQMSISTLVRVGGLSHKESMDLERFRDELVERITALASPE